MAVIAACLEHILMLGYLTVLEVSEHMQEFTQRPHQVNGFSADVSVPGSVSRLASLAQNNFADKTIDVWINNAGMGTHLLRALYLVYGPVSRMASHLSLACCLSRDVPGCFVYIEYVLSDILIYERFALYQNASK